MCVYVFRSKEPSNVILWWDILKVFMAYKASLNSVVFTDCEPS